MMRWIIVITILAAAALGYYYLYPNREMTEQSPATEQPAAGEETAAIERELEATSVEGLDAELGDIERELSQ